MRGKTKRKEGRERRKRERRRGKEKEKEQMREKGRQKRPSSPNWPLQRFFQEQRIVCARCNLLY